MKQIFLTLLLINSISAFAQEDYYGPGVQFEIEGTAQNCDGTPVELTKVIRIEEYDNKNGAIGTQVITLKYGTETFVKTYPFHVDALTLENLKTKESVREVCKTKQGKITNISLLGRSQEVCVVKSGVRESHYYSAGYPIHVVNKELIVNEDYLCEFSLRTQLKKVERF